MNTEKTHPHFTTLHFFKGFEHKGRMFGFKEKKLYRLPYVYQNRNYPLKEIAFKNDHFRVYRDKLSKNIIESKIENIDIIVKVFEKHSDLPF